MAALQRGLGRGLDALLSGFQDDLEAPEVVLVPIGKIRANPNQPRRDFDDGALEDLAASIKANGVLQPVLVRPLQGGPHMYELVAGERRWRASQLAGQADIPAIIKRLSDEESLAIALIENLQREDLNPIEEALGLKRLQDEFSLTQEDLATRVGKSRPAIANTLRLMQLPDDVRDDIRTGRMSAGHGRALLAIDNVDAQETLRARILEEGLSVRECEALAAYFKRTGHLPDNGTGPRPTGKKGAPREILPVITELNTRLQDSLNLRVKITGDTEQGRLTVTYKDQAEFLNLMNRLGLSVTLD
ncbi:ParB family chromosome partitioning protein [Desulfobaculum xiamenense]|uniref:ParB family chromosome partitioning protein n=1 Tax=Desulfobaculum xiamenense TaxID=995050 RepID=A0A846QGQ9_9BACT|nr:ParB/RepB/Spo0J family partition protein [Desulfobaculum xiamenense]NJB67986.1 ParB family chromosome partitioning protein [Desulfobaculum xiamenense]